MFNFNPFKRSAKEISLKAKVRINEQQNNSLERESESLLQEEQRCLKEYEELVKYLNDLKEKNKVLRQVNFELNALLDKRMIQEEARAKAKAKEEIKKLPSYEDYLKSFKEALGEICEHGK
ncbi:hypothetical protein [Cylindrospermopsis raciborskii]|uniref:hypothetical protein n=1 Tax=Cylindrospermopsis raciborskii TaxID=77022 RepID=UPI000C1C6697|nr:hypothetical protein [Cylindrospermopsis raciborskii]MCZ2207791.1 hypothetical protein [Cylindrospermopsis raciborskii PAMP2011]